MAGQITTILDAVRTATIAQAAPVLPEPIAPGDPLPAPPSRPPLRIIDGGGGRSHWHAFRRFLPGFVAGASWQGVIAFLASAALALRRDPLREPHPYQQIPILREPPRTPHVEPTPQQRWALFLRDAPLARRHPHLFDAAFRMLTDEEQWNAQELFRQLQFYYGHWTPEATLRSIAWAAVEARAAGLSAHQRGNTLQVVAIDRTGALGTSSAIVRNDAHTEEDEEEIRDAILLVRSFAPHSLFPVQHRHRCVSVARVIEACPNRALVELLFTITPNTERLLPELVRLGDQLPVLTRVIPVETIIARATAQTFSHPASYFEALNTILERRELRPRLTAGIISEAISVAKNDAVLLEHALETIASGIRALTEPTPRDIQRLVSNAIKSERFHRNFSRHDVPSAEAAKLARRLSPPLPGSLHWKGFSARAASVAFFQGGEGTARLAAFIDAIAAEEIDRSVEFFERAGHDGLTARRQLGTLFNWKRRGEEPISGLRPEHNLEDVITIAIDLIALPKHFLSAFHNDPGLGEFAYQNVLIAKRFRRSAEAAQTVSGPITDLWQVLRHSLEMETMRRATFGLIDERQALEAMHNKAGILHTWLQKPLFAVLQHDPLHKHATFRPHPKIRISFANGIFESECGFCFLLELSTGKGHRMLASLGFIETDDAIKIVQYQGGNLSKRDWPALKKAFHVFSGNVDPLPWLALAAGRQLLARARAEGKRLEFIRGEYIWWGYPDKDLDSLRTIEEGRRYWHTPPARIRHLERVAAQLRARIHGYREELRENPSNEEALSATIFKFEMFEQTVQHSITEYHRGPTTARLYDATAENLGFRRRGKQPWYRFTKAPETFGTAIRKARGVDEERLQQSLDAFTGSLADPQTETRITPPGRFPLDMPPLSE